MLDSKNAKSSGHQKHTGPFYPIPSKPLLTGCCKDAAFCLHLMQVTLEVSSPENFMLNTVSYSVFPFVCHDVYVYNFIESP